MKSLTIVALLGLVLAAPVRANAGQPAPGETPRRQADALIASTGHPELFDNQSDDKELRIVHRISGLVCRFTPGDQENRLVVFSTLPVGDDVGCNTDVGLVNVAVYATRDASSASLDDEEVKAVSEIRRRWPDARPFEGAAFEAGIPDGFDSRFAAFTVGTSPRLGYTHLRLARGNGWRFMQRLSVDQTIAQRQDALVGAPRWTEVLTAAAAHQAAE